MEEILLGEGYTVRRCLHTPPTLCEIEQAGPIGMIVDIRRSDADACLLLLQHMRQNPALRSVGVLVSSTDGHLLADLSPQMAYMRCTTLVKPFDLYEFLEKISHAIEAAIGGDGHLSSQSPPSHPSPN